MSGPDLQSDGSLDRSDDSWRDETDSTQRSQLATSTAWIRLRGWIMTVPRLFGLAALLLGAYNLIVGAVSGDVLLTQYRVIGLVDHEGMLPIYLGDVAIMTVGAALLWFFTR